MHVKYVIIFYMKINGMLLQKLVAYPKTVNVYLLFLLLSCLHHPIEASIYIAKIVSRRITRNCIDLLKVYEQKCVLKFNLNYGKNVRLDASTLIGTPAILANITTIL